MVYILKEFDKEEINKICKEFSAFMDRLGFGDVSNSLHYILRELIYNAVKANLKRIFVRENASLAPENLIEEFRNALDSGSKAMLEQLGKEDLTVKVEFINVGDGVLARVHNSTNMLSEERDFVDKVLNTSEDEDLNQVLENGHREGAGLGLRSAIKIIKTGQS